MSAISEAEWFGFYKKNRIPHGGTARRDNSALPPPAAREFGVRGAGAEAVSVSAISEAEWGRIAKHLKRRIIAASGRGQADDFIFCRTPRWSQWTGLHGAKQEPLASPDRRYFKASICASLGGTARRDNSALRSEVAHATIRVSVRRISGRSPLRGQRALISKRPITPSRDTLSPAERALHSVWVAGRFSLEFQE